MAGRTPQQVAELFRFYAAFCREMADDPRWPQSERLNVLSLAAKWERDALIVLRDGELIREARTTLAQADAILTRGR